MVLGFHLHSELNPEKHHTCKHHQHSSSVRETQATRWISQDLEIEGREMKKKVLSAESREGVVSYLCMHFYVLAVRPFAKCLR